MYWSLRINVIPFIFFCFLVPIEVMGHVGAVVRAKSVSTKTPDPRVLELLKLARESSPNLFHSSDDGTRAFSIDWDSYIPSESDEETYIPYVGTSAMTNMPNFFQHLRENIKSLSRKRLESSNKRNVGKSCANGDGSDYAANPVYVYASYPKRASINSLRRFCRNAGIWNRNILFCTTF